MTWPTSRLKIDIFQSSQYGNHLYLTKIQLRLLSLYRRYFGLKLTTNNEIIMSIENKYEPFYWPATCNFSQSHHIPILKNVCVRNLNCLSLYWLIEKQRTKLWKLKRFHLPFSLIAYRNSLHSLHFCVYLGRIGRSEVNNRC